MGSIITVENLGKKYTIGHQKQGEYQTFRDTLAHGARSMYQRLRHPFSPNTEEIDTEEFWALKDINFEVKQGDRLGIIGRNGAGKSTLLKILSRITHPTTGRVHIKGRAASLLEVGTGFHPELTGRENIFLNGAILGMTKNDIKKRFDEIIAFAEIEKFLDTPVKRYSSGMYVRLAFAVAAHLEPEILIIDEVLAVGDAQFQKKCLGKMNEVSQQGRTVIFVSHNMRAISSLCNKALLIEDGSIVNYSDVDNIISQYLSNNTVTKKRFTPYKQSGVTLELNVSNKNRSNITEIYVGDDIGFEFAITSNLQRDNLQIGIGILNQRGLRITTLHTYFQTNNKYNLKNGNNYFKAIWKNNFLCAGKYAIEISLFDSNSNFAHFGSIGLIEIVDFDFFKTGKMPDTKYQGDVVSDVEWLKQ